MTDIPSKKTIGSEQILKVLPELTDRVTQSTELQSRSDYVSLTCLPDP
jgi:hypothetical protein